MLEEVGDGVLLGVGLGVGEGVGVYVGEDEWPVAVGDSEDDEVSERVPVGEGELLPVPVPVPV